MKDVEGWIIYVFNLIPILWRLKHMCQLLFITAEVGEFLLNKSVNKNASSTYVML